MNLDGNRGEYSEMMRKESMASPSTLPSAPPSKPLRAQAGIKPSTQASTQLSAQPPEINMASPFSKLTQQPSIINNAFPLGKKLKKTPTPKQEPLTPDQERLKGSLEYLGWNKFKGKIKREAAYAKKNPTPEPSISREDGLTFLMSVGTNFITVATDTAKVLIKQTPIEILKLVDEAKKDVNAPAAEFGLHISKKPLTQRPLKQRMRGGMTEDMTEDITEDMTGGIKLSKPSVKRFNKMLFSTAYIPGILTLFAFLFLLFFLLWVIIQGLLNRFLGDKYALPTIKFNKKTTQTIYSIFFVITSWFLMLYLFIDYFRNVGPELDIIQIFKQLVGASYILWPMLVLIIGSGISKAFYKISCNGNKPNVLSWAKIVESSALYVLGIAALITVILLFKPIKYIYEKIPELVQKRFLFITVMVAVTLKLMVIYILLRMLTIMMEDIISNKIVFFISKLNKDIEAPPVDCNVETKKTAKQSEIAKILEEIYMYISGIIVCIIIIFILVIQCPHPYVASTSKINHTIGAVFLQLTGIATRFIVENKYGKKNCSQKNKGSGLFKTPSWFSSLGKTGTQYSAEQLEEASKADAKDAQIQANDRKLGEAQDDRRREIARAQAEGRAQARAQENTKGTIDAYRRLFKGSELAPAQSAQSPQLAPTTGQSSPSTPAPREYVASNDDNRHSTAPEPKVDQNLRNNHLTRSQSPQRHKLPPMVVSQPQTLSATKPLAQKPLAPIPKGKGIDTNGASSGLPSQVSGDFAKPVKLSNIDTTERTLEQIYEDNR
jgi:hypothetical protein